MSDIYSCVKKTMNYVALSFPLLLFLLFPIVMEYIYRECDAFLFSSSVYVHYITNIFSHSTYNFTLRAYLFSKTIIWLNCEIILYFHFPSWKKRVLLIFDWLDSLFYRLAHKQFMLIISQNDKIRILILLRVTTFITYLGISHNI